MDVKIGEIVLCNFYFSDTKQSKNRPVLVLKDNLPFNDFIAIPISSQLTNQQSDEVLIDNQDFLVGSIPKKSKVMLRKTFVVSKTVVIKCYGELTEQSFNKYKTLFCRYFDCECNTV